jgi:hypothetical protein
MMMLLPWRLSAAVALVTLGGLLCTGDVDAALADPSCSRCATGRRSAHLFDQGRRSIHLQRHDRRERALRAKISEHRAPNPAN